MLIAQLSEERMCKQQTFGDLLCDASCLQIAALLQNLHLPLCSCRALPQTSGPSGYRFLPDGLSLDSLLCTMLLPAGTCSGQMHTAHNSATCFASAITNRSAKSVILASEGICSLLSPKSDFLSCSKQQTAFPYLSCISSA